ncbi:MAG: hypothetical protein DRI69_00025 [Bacteroidetes bacterium]|nr:MAG: hypothetical protein DRI69_00025 [Bacteroidota bacterium]
MTPKRKYQIKAFGLAIMFGLSIASFAYLNSVSDTMRVEQPNIYVEDVEEEPGELLPDMQIIKLLMNKTLDFVIRTQPL